ADRYGDQTERADPRGQQAIQQFADCVFVHLRMSRKRCATAAQQVWTSSYRERANCDRSPPHGRPPSG
ncbi:hypothetical protein SB761_26250, partial [Pseudomonas sp. SIMBA_064]